MGFEWLLTLVETNSYTAITWDMLSSQIGSEEKLRKYLKEKPMPKSVTYKNEEEFIDDIKNAGGVITISSGETDEFKQWLLDLVYNFF